MATPAPTHWRGWPHHLAQALLAMAVVLCIYMTGMFLFMVSSLLFMCPQTRGDRARLDIKNIENAFKLYRQKKGRYPSTSEGLQALVSIQALEQLPTDPWGNEYHYALWKNVPRIWSYGADGLPGGDGANADIYNLSLLPRWLLESDEPPQVSPPAPLPSPLRCWGPLETDSQCGV